MLLLDSSWTYCWAPALKRCIEKKNSIGFFSFAFLINCNKTERERGRERVRERVSIVKWLMDVLLNKLEILFFVVYHNTFELFSSTFFVCIVFPSTEFIIILRYTTLLCQSVQVLNISKMDLFYLFFCFCCFWKGKLLCTSLWHYQSSCWNTHVPVQARKKIEMRGNHNHWMFPSFFFLFFFVFQIMTFFFVICYCFFVTMQVKCKYLLTS